MSDQDDYGRGRPTARTGATIPTQIILPDGRSFQLNKWTAELLRVSADDVVRATVHGEELLIQSIMVFPPRGMTELQSEPLGTLELRYGSSMHGGPPVWQAPVESLINRWLLMTRVDEHFETRALWIVAEEIIERLRKSSDGGSKQKDLVETATTYLAAVGRQYLEWRGLFSYVPLMIDIGEQQLWKLSVVGAPRPMQLDVELAVLHRR